MPSCDQEQPTMQVELSIKNHKFVPEQLSLPANIKVSLIVNNEDKTAEEFESFDLKKERIIPGKKKISIIIGPLKPGTYKFFGEFHAETAQGIIKVQ
jgi:hypothetical protein